MPLTPERDCQSEAPSTVTDVGVSAILKSRGVWRQLKGNGSGYCLYFDALVTLGPNACLSASSNSFLHTNWAIFGSYTTSGPNVTHQCQCNKPHATVA